MLKSNKIELLRSIGPDFIGIGAQRCGTSWLYNCLLEHPDIFMPQKEVHYFDKLHKTHDINWYSALFSQASNTQTSGEITPDYMYLKDCIKEIHKNYPETKLIIILRNPIERSFSAFNLFKSHGRFKNMTFDEALKAEGFLLEQSLYYKQLENVYQYFNKEQVLIKFYEDITDKPLEFYQTVCEFLQIDDRFKPNSLKIIKNSSALSSSQSKFNIPAVQKRIEDSVFKKPFQFFKSTKLANYIKRKVATNKNKIEIDSSSRNIIVNDIKKLEKLLDISLTHWRE
ncbi:MAG: hypothetical protein ACI9LE_001287 [Paraglaciecola sp.]|jgi:hypothetical protein